MTSKDKILFSLDFKWLIKSLENLYKISSKNEYNKRLNGIYLEVKNDGKCISLKGSNGNVFIENSTKIEIHYYDTDDKNFSFFLSNEQVLSFVSIYGKIRDKEANFTYKKITEGINEKFFLNYVTLNSLSECEEYSFECCEDDIINYPRILVKPKFSTCTSFDIDIDKVKNYIKGTKFITGLPIEELYCSGDMPKDSFLEFSMIKEKEENETIINEMFFRGRERTIKKITLFTQFYRLSTNELSIFLNSLNPKDKKITRVRTEVLSRNRITGDLDARECLTFEVWNKNYSDFSFATFYLKPTVI